MSLPHAHTAAATAPWTSPARLRALRDAVIGSRTKKSQLVAQGGLPSLVDALRLLATPDTDDSHHDVVVTASTILASIAQDATPPTLLALCRARTVPHLLAAIESLVERIHARHSAGIAAAVTELDAAEALPPTPPPPPPPPQPLVLSLSELSLLSALLRSLRGVLSALAAYVNSSSRLRSCLGQPGAASAHRRTGAALSSSSSALGGAGPGSFPRAPQARGGAAAVAAAANLAKQGRSTRERMDWSLASAGLPREACGAYVRTGDAASASASTSATELQPLPPHEELVLRARLDIASAFRSPRQRRGTGGGGGGEATAPGWLSVLLHRRPSAEAGGAAARRAARGAAPRRPAAADDDDGATAPRASRLAKRPSSMSLDDAEGCAADAPDDDAAKPPPGPGEGEGDAAARVAARPLPPLPAPSAAKLLGAVEMACDVVACCAGVCGAGPGVRVALRGELEVWAEERREDVDGDGDGDEDGVARPGGEGEREEGRGDGGVEARSPAEQIEARKRWLLGLRADASPLWTWRAAPASSSPGAGSATGQRRQPTTIGGEERRTRADDGRVCASVIRRGKSRSVSVDRQGLGRGGGAAAARLDVHARGGAGEPSERTAAPAAPAAAALAASDVRDADVVVDDDDGGAGADGPEADDADPAAFAGSDALLDALLDVAECGSAPRAQEAALWAVAELVHDSRDACAALFRARTPSGQLPTSLLLGLRNHASATVRLAAFSALAHVMRRHAFTPRTTHCVLAVLSLLCAHDGPGGGGARVEAGSGGAAPSAVTAAAAMRAVAMLVADDAALQAVAVERLALLDVVGGALERCRSAEGRSAASSTSAVPADPGAGRGGAEGEVGMEGDREGWYHREARDDSVVMLKEAALTVLGALALRSDELRRRIAEHAHPPLLPSVFGSLSPATPLGVRLAAIRAVRALSRSISILRTSLVDADVAAVLLGVLERADVDAVVPATPGDGSDSRPGVEDPEVVAEATAAVCNLVADFSPMKQAVVERGGVERLVALCAAAEGPPPPTRGAASDGEGAAATSPYGGRRWPRRRASAQTRLNALWALKNLSYRADSALKRRVAASLGWPRLHALALDERGDDAAAQEQALCVLRNLVSQRADDVAMVMRGLAEAARGGRERGGGGGGGGADEGRDSTGAAAAANGLHAGSNGASAAPSTSSPSSSSASSSSSRVDAAPLLDLVESVVWQRRGDAHLEQAAHVLANVAAAGAAWRWEVVRRANLVDALVYFLDHEATEVKRAGLALALNLTERVATPTTTTAAWATVPRGVDVTAEALGRLGAFGVDVAALRLATTHSDLDVAEMASELATRFE